MLVFKMWGKVCYTCSGHVWKFQIETPYSKCVWNMCWRVWDSLVKHHECVHCIIYNKIKVFE